jgi:hypothetical protein
MQPGKRFCPAVFFVPFMRIFTHGYFCWNFSKSVFARLVHIVVWV